MSARKPNPGKNNTARIGSRYTPPKRRISAVWDFGVVQLPLMIVRIGDPESLVTFSLVIVVEIRIRSSSNLAISYVWILQMEKERRRRTLKVHPLSSGFRGSPGGEPRFEDPHREDPPTMKIPERI